MIQINGNIWSFAQEKDAVICVTTNGVVNRVGRLIMGRGIALQAAYGRPNLPLILGEHVLKNGNIPKLIEYFDNTRLVSFPTKKHWRDDSDLTLIENSAIILQRLSERRPELTFYSPRPGCGNGNLSWDKVKKVIAPILGDKFIIVNKEL